MFAALAVALAVETAKAADLPTDFAEGVITANGVITAGTAMAFAPDGKLFVLEQAGTIEVYQGSGDTAWTRLQANFLANAPISVSSEGERGLLGIAFDPNYASNRFVYLYYTQSNPLRNRISRFTANASGTLALAGSEAVLMNLDALSSANIHNGGALQFGTDGTLYVAVGDNSAGANSQLITNRFGKLLRLNANPASPIPADNPSTMAGIAGTTSGDNRAIWAAGLRNPFTFAVHPVSGVIYINDVGAGSFEEINVGAAGANYGWSLTEGPFAQRAFPSFTHPRVYYHRTHSSLSQPPLAGFTGAAIAGGAFYVPAIQQFPCVYTGDFFFADYIGSWIKRYDPVSHTVHDFASFAQNPVDIDVGPDGALYYLARNAVDFNLGHVLRVYFFGSAASNSADINCDGLVGIADLLAVIGAWGPCGTPNDCPADIAPAPDGDGIVGVGDLLEVIGKWGSA